MINNIVKLLNMFKSFELLLIKWQIIKIKLIFFSKLRSTTYFTLAARYSYVIRWYSFARTSHHYFLNKRLFSRTAFT